MRWLLTTVRTKKRIIEDICKILLEQRMSLEKFDVKLVPGLCPYEDTSSYKGNTAKSHHRLQT